jgi:multicomponent Na+:H+ antiporter subunit B
MSGEHEPGMSLIVKTITRLTVGLILLFGIYVLLHGHLTPGGGFAGGVIIALSLVHIMLAFGKEKAFDVLSVSGAKALEGLGAVMFLAVALLGLAWGAFFLNFIPKGTVFELFSAGTIPISNIAIACKVGAGLFSIFVALVIIGKKPTEKK